jgi:hypothetical protein
LRGSRVYVFDTQEDDKEASCENPVFKRMNDLGSFPLRGLVELALNGRPWRAVDDDLWCHMTPPDYPSRVQGWKLHISATRVSAPLVLHRVAKVLVKEECGFKFARTLGVVQEITGKLATRSQAGKFVTAYPRDDDHFRRLTTQLDQATADLPGPAILSDRPYRQGSLVHYRFGAFNGVRVLNNDGSYEVRLRAPDGSLVEDPRQPWFCPPSWVELPFGGKPGREASRPASPKPVLLAGRFEVRGTITSSACGGVHRAVDRRTGGNVVIKRARPHISGLAWQGDAREGLRREARLLRQLEGIAARPIMTFEKDENLFLVLEEVPGTPLVTWVRNRLTEGVAHTGQEGLPVDEALHMTSKLADLINAVHERGVVYRDFTFNNILVTGDGNLRLIDAELAATQGEWVMPAHTPGFGAPETLVPEIAPAPERGADCYSLGAVLCYLSAGVVPAFAADSSTDRSTRERIEIVLRYSGPRNLAAATLTPAVLGLTEPDPAQRWTTDNLRQWLSQPPKAPRIDVSAARLEPERQQTLLDGGLTHLVAHADTTRQDRLFSLYKEEAVTDPLNVQFGAAGVLAVLTRASEIRGDRDLRRAVARVAGWIDERLLSAPKLLPGLYFGRTGTAWALYDAALHLEDDALAERALLLLNATPVRWPNPDITHGVSGAGMASLHIWRRSGDPGLKQRVESCIDAVMGAVERDGDRIHWPLPRDFDSALAGIDHYGFAHGIAGNSAFLLAAGRATGRHDAVEMARHGGDTLLSGAIRQNGAAYWPDSFSGPADGDLRYHWCSGASGVGTFLVRLWQATNGDAYLQLAREAAVAVHQSRWLAGFAACHGTAGDGEFLLDMAAATTGPYRRWADELAANLYARHAIRDGNAVAVDELTNEVNLAYNTGLSGVVGFLLRLRHGGPRWWMVDEANGVG